MYIAALAVGFGFVTLQGFRGVKISIEHSSSSPISATQEKVNKQMVVFCIESKPLAPSTDRSRVIVKMASM